MHMNSHNTACNNAPLLRILPSRISHSEAAMDTAGLGGGNYDFVFVDMYRNIFRDQEAGVSSKEAFLFNAIDLFVTPLDATSGAEVQSIAESYAVLDAMGHDNRLLVHMSSFLPIFGFDCFLKDMKPWKHMLYDETIPKLCSGPFAEPVTFTFAQQPNAGFSSDDIRSRFWRLFAAILERIGLDAEEKLDVDKMDFFALVNLIAPATKITA